MTTPCKSQWSNCKNMHRPSRSCRIAPSKLEPVRTVLVYIYADDLCDLSVPRSDLQCWVLDLWEITAEATTGGTLRFLIRTLNAEFLARIVLHHTTQTVYDNSNNSVGIPLIASPVAIWYHRGCAIRVVHIHQLICIRLLESRGSDRPLLIA